jgi:poly-gamma-glutamate synthesis protein (capsule biosynthesis protein)
METYQLKKGQLTVQAGDGVLWQSPRQWRIQSCLTADADNDGAEELLLVLWKKGSFGPSKPMWQEGKDDEYSNHLFLYRLVAGKIKPAWCSSALIHPIIKLEVKDINNDGKNELKVVEGPEAGTAYSLRRFFNHHQTEWIWSGWGFAKL